MQVILIARLAPQVLKSGACVLGIAYGFDYVLKAANARHAAEHARQHEFQSIIGELRAARQAKFEQPRPVIPRTHIYVRSHRAFLTRPLSHRRHLVAGHVQARELRQADEQLQLQRF